MDLFTTRNYKKDSIIYMENSKPFPYFFIIKSGEVKETLILPEKEEWCIYKPGDTIGLITCLTGNEYLQRLTAVTDSELILVKRENLIEFLSSKKNIFMKIISDYSNRLRELDQKLINLTSNSIFNQLPEQLLSMAEYFKRNKQMENCLYALLQYVKLSKEESVTEKIKEEIIKIEYDLKVKIQEPQKFQSRLVYKQGQIIFLEQERGKEFYFIEKGKVKISHIDKEREFILSILGEKEFFGEMAMLNRRVRSACAIAYEDTRLMRITKDNFMDELPAPILRNVFVSFAKRLWYSYRRVLNLNYKAPSTRLYDCLDLIIKSKYATKEKLSYHFDLSLQDLRSMTNTRNIDDEDIKDFLYDDNISLTYGKIAIIDIRKFEERLKFHICRERMIC